MNTESVTPNTWTATWPRLESALSASAVTLKCVSVGNACDAVPDAPVTVVGPLENSGTVEGLYPLNSYWCYAITKGKLLKKPVCSDPVLVNTPQNSQVYTQDFFYPESSARAPASPVPIWGSAVTICQFNSVGKIDTCRPSGLTGYNTSFGVIRTDQRYGWWVTYDTFGQSPQLVTSCALEPTGEITQGSCRTVYDRNETSAQVWSLAFNEDQTQVSVLSQARGVVGKGDTYISLCDVAPDASFVCDAPVMILDGTSPIAANNLFFTYIDPSENYLYITGQTLLGAATGVKCSLQSASCGPMVANVSAQVRTGLFSPDVAYPEINSIAWFGDNVLVSYRTSGGKYLIDACSFDLATGDFIDCSSFQTDPTKSYLPNGRPYYIFEGNNGNEILVYGATGRASLHLYLYVCPVQSGVVGVGLGSCQLASDNANVTGISFPTFNGIILID